MTTLGPTRVEPVGVRGSEMSTNARCNSAYDEGSSGRDNSGDHKNSENVGVKNNYKVRGECLIGQSGSDNEKGDKWYSHSNNDGCCSRVNSVQVESGCEETGGGTNTEKILRHRHRKGL